MAHPQDLPSRQMVFTKYPELPEDIRLIIIDETIQVARQEFLEHNSWERNSQEMTKSFLFPLASVNHEWNRVIEMLLFNHLDITPSCLSEFAQICGKRHGRLNTIILSIMRSEIPSGDRPEAYVGAAIAQLFNIMKDWSHGDRERQGLLKVALHFISVLQDYPPGTSLNCNFASLPKVPIICALYEIGCQRLLHPSSSIRLYQSCPNIRYANLSLPFLDQLNESTEQASNAISSLANARPDLTHLGLSAHLHPSRQPVVRGVWMPAADCVAAFPPSWTNNLMELDLRNMHDLPRFFLETSRSDWPNLMVIKLHGFMDNENMTKAEVEGTARQTCTALVQGLIAMLPGIPKISRVLIKMGGTVGYYGSIIHLGMRIGNPVRIDYQHWPKCDHWARSRSYRFVSSHDNGEVLAAGAGFPGHLATELQHTVRRHQLKDLGVFFEKEESLLWGIRRLCWQWNSEGQCWDAAFEEEADEFIYQMGEYFDSTESM